MKRRTDTMRESDAAAVFTELYRRHHGAVLAFCVRRSTDEQEAHDAVAEAFTIAWRRLSQARDPSLPWLLAIARRTLANRRRGAARRDALVQRLAAVDRCAVTACHSDGVHDRLALRDAFAELAPADREALALWAWDRLSASEAATVLETTPAAYAVRLLRARRRLAARLETAARDRAERSVAAVPKLDARRTHA